MAVRKSTMQQQVAEAVAQAVPGDRALVTFYTISGMSPWLKQGMIGAIAAFTTKYYFVTLTEQYVVLHKASLWSARPQEVVLVVPRAEAAGLVSDVKLNVLWSKLRFQLPGNAKPTRLNVHRIWRAELDQFVAGLTPQQTPVAY